MNNIESCAQWIFDQRPGKDVRVLDYGCGSGDIVKELRASGVEAYGCDVFYEGGDYSPTIDPRYFDAGIIKRITENTIPFESSSFELVVNKMVMEHVENLDDVLIEINRVLKPGGMVLSIFPDKSVWHEGHCGIPFLHWFSKAGRGRVCYAAAWRALGFGYHKGTKTVMQWSEDFCDWLDKWTYYRTRHEIDTSYSKFFPGIRHIEDYWLKLRLGRRKSLVTWLPTPTQRLIVQKFSTLVFVAQKPNQVVAPHFRHGRG